MGGQAVGQVFIQCMLNVTHYARRSPSQACLTICLTMLSAVVLTHDLKVGTIAGANWSYRVLNTVIHCYTDVARVCRCL